MDKMYADNDPGYALRLAEYHRKEMETAEGAVASDEELSCVMRWLGERIERRKLERLGNLMPWHEFK